MTSFWDTDSGESVCCLFSGLKYSNSKKMQPPVIMPSASAMKYFFILPTPAR